MLAVLKLKLDAGCECDHKILFLRGVLGRDDERFFSLSQNKSILKICKREKVDYFLLSLVLVFNVS